MTPDSELTILLTLKDRPAFTYRWMSYADHVRLPFKVLIADGGSDEGVPRVLSDRANFPNVDYQYVRYPFDRSYADYYAKIDDALAHVRTPLVALADNDDFFIVGSVRDAARFLLDHPDYAACGGQVAGFWIAPHGPREEQDVVYGAQVEWKWSAETESLDDGTARDRIRRKSLKTTYATYYHVQRTEDLRRHFRLIRQADPRDLFLFEQVLAFLTATVGKSKQLDTLYLARQYNAPESSATTHQNVAGDWLGRMLLPTWSGDFANFLGVTSAALAETDGISLEEAQRCVIEAYRMEVAPAILADLVQEPTVTLPMCIATGLVQSLLRLSPGDRLRRVARTFYRRIRWVSVDVVQGTELRAKPVPRAREAFAPIDDFLRCGSELVDAPTR